MNISTIVSKYLKSMDVKTQQFYKDHNKVKKFVIPAFTSSSIQERIIRLGIEDRCLGKMTTDELYLVAGATLHEDYMKYCSGNMITPICNILDVKAIFTKQLEQETNLLYFMKYINEKVEVVSIKLNEYDWVLSNYKYAELSGDGIIPTLY